MLAESERGRWCWGVSESPGGTWTSPWHHQASSLWLLTMHHGEIQPHLSHSPAALTYALAHGSTEKWQANSQSLLLFLFFFFPHCFGLCPSLGTGEGAPPTAGAGPGCSGVAVACRAGTHRASQPRPGWACGRLPAPLQFSLRGLCKPHQQGWEGKPSPSPSRLAGFGGSRQRLLVGFLLLGGGARRPSPLFIQHRQAGYKRLPVKISFGTSIQGRAFAKEKYCRQALGKQRYSSRGK